MIKKTLTICLLSSLITVFAAGTSLKWEKLSLDLGIVKVQEQTELTFPFTNSSLEDITILEAKGSCGCTEVVYPKETIKPGTSAKITAKFKASKVGTFNKTIKVKTSNSAAYTILSFRGEAVN